jgi:hypothetical protein
MGLGLPLEISEISTELPKSESVAALGFSGVWTHTHIQTATEDVGLM